MQKNMKFGISFEKSVPFKTASVHQESLYIGNILLVQLKDQPPKMTFKHY